MLRRWEIGAQHRERLLSGAAPLPDEDSDQADVVGAPTGQDEIECCRGVRACLSGGQAMASPSCAICSRVAGWDSST